MARNGKPAVSPRMMQLLEEEHRALRDFERWYSRLKRAFNSLEKQRARLKSIKRRMQLEGEVNPS